MGCETLGCAAGNVEGGMGFTNIGEKAREEIGEEKEVFYG